MNTFFLLAAALTATNAVTTLPTVVVEASRLGLTKQEIAAHVDVLGRGDIDSSGAVSTVDLLEKRANIFFRKMNANPLLAEVSMRGYGANGYGRVRIVVDGVELNNPDMFAQNLMDIPLRSIEKVEILHGPQTVLHGGNASAGVINITTDADSYERRTGLEVHGGSWGTIGASADTRGGFEDLGLTYYGNFAWDHSDGWRDNNGFDLWALKAGFKQRFDNGAWYAVKAFFNDSRYGLPGGLYTGKASNGTDYGDWRDDPRKALENSMTAHNTTYGFSASGEGAIDDENKANGSITFRQRQSTGYADYDVYSIAAKATYLNDHEFGGFENRFALGTDLSLDLLYGRAYDARTRSGADNDYSRFTGAVFARDEFFVFEDLSVFGGARGEWIHSRNICDLHRPPTTTDSRTQGAVGGDVGLNWHPLDGLKVFARWTPFFHSPLADELISTYGIANMNLKPEHGHTTEVGVDWTFLDDFNFNITGFHTELSDEIAYYNYSNRNLEDDTRRDGFETSLVWERKKTGSAGILYTFTEASFAEGANKGNLVPLVPRQQLRVFGEIYLHETVAVHGGYRFVGEQRYGGDYAGNGGMMPCYGVFDIGLRVMPTWRWLEGFTFAVTCDNLFDKRYCDYGEYFDPWYVYPAAGRSFLFTVRYEF